MKRFIIFLVLALNGCILFSQVTIDDGAVVKLSKATHFVSQMNVNIEGKLCCDTSTIFCIGEKNWECHVTSYNHIKFYSLKIVGTTYFNVDSIELAGDMIMDNGLLHFKNIRLFGNILNENEDGYIASGKVEKQVFLTENQKTNSGIGLNFTPNITYDSLMLCRGHTKQNNREEVSIAKYYEFPKIVNLSSIDFSFLNSQSEKNTDTYLLYYKTPFEDWKSIESETNNQTKRVISRQSSSQDVQHLTLFPFPELNYSKYITPNGDGRNDYFEIIGIEKCPNSKLIVLAPNGKIVYTNAPYKNDFNSNNEGANLPAGAYYYMFYCDEKGSPTKRGYFEIIK